MRSLVWTVTVDGKRCEEAGGDLPVSLHRDPILIAVGAVKYALELYRSPFVVDLDVVLVEMASRWRGVDVLVRTSFTDARRRKTRQMRKGLIMVTAHVHCPSNQFIRPELQLPPAIRRRKDEADIDHSRFDLRSDVGQALHLLGPTIFVPAPPYDEPLLDQFPDGASHCDAGDVNSRASLNLAGRMSAGRLRPCSILSRRISYT